MNRAQRKAASAVLNVAGAVGKGVSVVADELDGKPDPKKKKAKPEPPVIVSVPSADDSKVPSGGSGWMLPVAVLLGAGLLAMATKK